jgi:hypothetical protein
MKIAIFLMAVLASVQTFGQALRVFSEFVLFDKAGNPAPAQPREILSPAIVRNGFTSFQIAIQAASLAGWTLYVGQNPEDAFRITLYRRSGDKLEAIRANDQPVRGQGPEILWMDVWADRAAPIQRVKVEPQLMLGADWVIYPMEARVMEAVVPDLKETDPPDVRTLLCGPRRYFSYLSRNERQDVALAKRAPKEELLRLMGGCNPSTPAELNPEWYLRIRDYLFRLR